MGSKYSLKIVLFLMIFKASEIRSLGFKKYLLKLPHGLKICQNWPLIHGQRWTGCQESNQTPESKFN